MLIMTVLVWAHEQIFILSQQIPFSAKLSLLDSYTERPFFIVLSSSKYSRHKQVEIDTHSDEDSK